MAHHGAEHGPSLSGHLDVPESNGLHGRTVVTGWTGGSPGTCRPYGRPAPPDWRALVQFPPVIGRRPNHSPGNGCFKKHTFAFASRYQQSLLIEFF